MRVIVKSGATTEEVAAIQDVLASFGVEAEVNAGETASAAEMAALGLIILGVPFRDYIKAIAEDAGHDTWHVVKAWTHQLFEAGDRRRRQKGTIRVTDSETGAIVIFTPQVPDDGYREFVRQEFQAQGYYLWNPDLGRWEKVVSLDEGPEDRSDWSR